ncbi:hypothetical protein BSK65_28800 [Paenibacillus odorifer]|uniref:Phosphoribulokinase n=1 Tax=Paenibacillus odorifer TaxID=189426 RepID=A0A1R0Z8E2_9BACL|nr:hypothetical protein [Paenibacillus odorifer]OME64377.1 hypothetical protein BSK65_28800 [Paenibacillus odorifer]
MHFKKYNWFLIILFFKIIVMILFSSGYQDELFKPFVEYFTTYLNNPWEHFYEINYFDNPFPYPPLMLYILSLFYFPGAHLDLPLIVDNFLMKLPGLLSDVFIYALLVKLYPLKKDKVLLYYFASPIVFYAFYIHSQLDLLPTAVLFFSLYLLIKEHWKSSAIVFGFAIAIKFHVIAALPLVLIYLFHYRKKVTYVSYYLGATILVFLIICAPFIGAEAFREYVLKNKEQSQIFAIYFAFGNLKLYLAPLAVFSIYLRFMVYKKINPQLLFSFVGLLFSVFILLVPPMPAWYIWIIPYISIYFINQVETNTKYTLLLNLVLSVTYLVYFMVYHHSALNDITFYGQSINLKSDIDSWGNLSFTLLEGSLLASIYFSYRYGLKNNDIYKYKNSPLLIGIGGDSGSGKSILLDDIYKLLHDKDILLIEGDGDHKWERGNENWKQLTHLNPKANYLHRQSEDIMALKRGESIERVEYDHGTGGFTNPRKVKSKDYVIVSGLHPFYLPKMRKALDLKIYLETEENLRRHWKVLRDTKKRGYSKEKVIQSIEERMVDAQKYIWPQKQFADLVICYFTEELLEVGNVDCVPNLKLKLTVDSNLNMEDLLDELSIQNIAVEHDYSEDLKSQFFIIDQEEREIDFKSIADKIIQNREEIILDVSIWHSDYRGIVQLLILLMISEKLKEERRS